MGWFTKGLESAYNAEQSAKTPEEQEDEARRLFTQNLASNPQTLPSDIIGELVQNGPYNMSHEDIALTEEAMDSMPAKGENLDFDLAELESLKREKVDELPNAGYADDEIETKDESYYGPRKEEFENYMATSEAEAEADEDSEESKEIRRELAEKNRPRTLEELLSSAREKQREQRKKEILMDAFSQMGAGFAGLGGTSPVKALRTQKGEFDTESGVIRDLENEIAKGKLSKREQLRRDKEKRVIGQKLTDTLFKRRDKVFGRGDVKKLLDQGVAFSQVDRLMQAVKSGNQVAVQAIGTKMARAMGEVGVLTENDVKRYIAGTSYGRKVIDWIDKGFKGTISPDSQNDINDMVKLMQGITDEKIRPIAEDAINQAYENTKDFYGISREDVARRMFPEYGSPRESQSTEGYSPQQEAGIKNFMKAKNYSREEAIKKLKAGGRL
jgi:hypothetical protein